MKIDKVHWENFYKNGHLTTPSSFALFCLAHLPAQATVVDLGCGNGRDTFLFASKGHKVIAVDQSAVAISKIMEHGITSIEALQQDMKELHHSNIDVAYSRFSLHSITEETEEKVLNWMQQAVKKNGLVCIEVRSDKDDESAFVFGTDHYRRPLNFERLKEKIIQRGFHLKFATEERGLAVYKTEDPLVIRIIAKKL